MALVCKVRDVPNWYQQNYALTESTKYCSDNKYPAIDRKTHFSPRLSCFSRISSCSNLNFDRCRNSLFQFRFMNFHRFQHDSQNKYVHWLKEIKHLDFFSNCLYHSNVRTCKYGIEYLKFLLEERNRLYTACYCNTENDCMISKYSRFLQMSLILKWLLPRFKQRLRTRRPPKTKVCFPYLPLIRLSMMSHKFHQSNHQSKLLGKKTRRPVTNGKVST